MNVIHNPGAPNQVRALKLFLHKEKSLRTAGIAPRMLFEPSSYIATRGDDSNVSVEKVQGEQNNCGEKLHSSLSTCRQENSANPRPFNDAGSLGTTIDHVPFLPSFLRNRKHSAASLEATKALSPSLPSHAASRTGGFLPACDSVSRSGVFARK